MLLKEDIVDIEKPDGFDACFRCRRVFRIIFTSNQSFYYTLKICINNKWCSISFYISIKF